jgi:hypothetical protein
MRKLTTAVVAGFVAAVSLVGTTAPAQASATGFDVSRGPDAVTYAGCRDYAASYSVPSNIQNSSDWVLEVVTYDPAGNEVDRSSLTSVHGISDGGSDPASGKVGLMICSTGKTGTYRVDANLDYYNALGLHSYDHDSDTFTVRHAASRTGLGVNDTTAGYGQTLHFTASSSVERPSGYVANGDAAVRLQKYVDGAWRTIATRRTDSHGKAHFSVAWNHRSTVKTRAVTVGTDDYAHSISGQRAIY